MYCIDIDHPKDLKVLFSKIACFDLNGNNRMELYRPLSMKMLRVLFLSMRRYRVIDSD